MVVETYRHRNETHKKISHEYIERWLAALDLGGTIDYTALVIMRYTQTPLDKWRDRRLRMVNARPGTFMVRHEQEVEEFFDVMHVERLPLGMLYREQAVYVHELLKRPPLNNIDVEIVGDASGFGAPILELLDELGRYPIKVRYTGSKDEEGKTLGLRTYGVGKMTLVCGLDAVLNAKQLRFAPNLAATEEIKEELRSFDRHFATNARNARNTATMQFGGRGNVHDDIVNALMLAVWRAKGGGGLGQERVRSYPVY